SGRRYWMPALAHAVANSPLQTSVALSGPFLMIWSNTFALVTTVGVNSCDGVSNRVDFGAGVLPLTNSYAVSAAASATVLIGLEIVMYWSPLMTDWAACRVASLPVTGGTGFTAAALNAAIAPPPVPSLA